MKKFYTLEITDRATYFDIEAESAEEAKDIALEWWAERIPKIKVFEGKLLTND